MQSLKLCLKTVIYEVEDKLSTIKKSSKFLQKNGNPNMYNSIEIEQIQSAYEDHVI